MTKALLPSLFQSRGRLINISSAAGKQAYRGLSAYSASKHAIVGFYNTLRMEIAGFGVDVITIYPGGMKTSIGDAFGKMTQEYWNLLTPEKQEFYGPEFNRGLEDTPNILGDPNLVVGKIIECITSPQPKNEYVVGKDATIFSWFPFVLPWLFYLSSPIPRGLKKQHSS